MTWTFKKDIGLISDDLKIKLTFGSERTTLRNLLKFDQSQNQGRSDSEDIYWNSSSDNWFRLSFDNNKLSEIEILRGTVVVDSVPIRLRTNLKETLTLLSDKNYVFKKGDNSFTDFENLIDIGDSETNGGDTNESVWFYTSTNFDHLRD